MARIRLAPTTLEPDFPQPERSWAEPVGVALRALWLALVWLGVLAASGVFLF